MLSVVGAWRSVVRTYVFYRKKNLEKKIEKRAVSETAVEKGESVF